MNAVRKWLSLVLCSALVACGGGGGTDAPPDPITLAVDPAVAVATSNAMLDSEGASFKLAVRQSVSAMSTSAPAAVNPTASSPVGAASAADSSVAAAQAGSTTAGTTVPATPTTAPTVPTGSSPAAPAASASASVAAQPAVAQVVQLIKVGELRRDRTVYDYSFKVVLRSPGKNLAQADARVLEVGDGTTVVSGSAIFDEVAAGAEATSKNTITLRHDRTKPFNANALRWAVATYTPLMRPAIEAVATRAVVDPAVLTGDGVLTAYARDPLLLADPTGSFGAVGTVMFFDGTVRRVVAVQTNAQGVRQLRTEELPLTAAFKDLAFTTRVNPLAALATLSSGATVQAGPDTLGRKFSQAVKRMWSSDALPPVMNFKALSLFDCVVPGNVLESEGGEASIRWEFLSCNTKTLGAALGQQWPNIGTLSGHLLHSSAVTYTRDLANRDDYTTTVSSTEWSGGIKADAGGSKTLVDFESENGNNCRVARLKSTCELWLLKQPLVSASVYVPVPGIPVPVPVVIEIKPRLTLEFSGEGEITAFHISTRTTVTGVKAGRRLPDPNATDFGSSGGTKLEDTSSGKAASATFSAEVQLMMVATADIGRLKYVSDTSLASVELGAGLYARGSRADALGARGCFSADVGAMASLQLAMLESDVLRDNGYFDGIHINLAEERWAWKDWASPEGCSGPVDASKPKLDSTSYTIAGTSNYTLDSVNTSARRDVYRASGQWLLKRQAPDSDQTLSIDLAKFLADNVRFKNLAILEPVVSSPRATGLSSWLAVNYHDDGTMRSALVKVKLGDARPGDKIVVTIDALVNEDGKREKTRVSRIIRIDFEEIPQVSASYVFERDPDGKTRFFLTINYGDTWTGLKAARVQRGGGLTEEIDRSYERPDEYLLRWQVGMDTPKSPYDDNDEQRPLWLLVETGSTTGNAAAYRYPIAVNKQVSVRSVLFSNSESGRVYADDEVFSPLWPMKFTVYGQNLPAELPVDINWCAGLAETPTEVFENGARSTNEREFTCTVSRVGQGLQTTVLGFAAHPRTVEPLTGLRLLAPDPVTQGEAAAFHLWVEQFSNYARSLVTVIWNLGDGVVQEVQNLGQQVTHIYATAGDKILALVYQVQGERIGGEPGYVISVQPGSAVSVTGVTPLLAVAGVEQTFDVMGANLPLGLVFNLDGCKNVTEVHERTNASLRRFTCTFAATAAEGAHDGHVAASSNIFGAAPYYSFKVRVSRVAVGPALPLQTMRSIATSFEFTGQNLPTTGLSVVPIGDNRSNCQAPHNATASGFGVACELFKVGAQVLEVRYGNQVLGASTVNVASNVTGVTWTSPSTNNSGTVRFGETVTFTVRGENLTTDPQMGFAVEKCGISSEEVGAGSATARTFACLFNNEAGAVAGQMPGVVKDTRDGLGQVLLDGWKVPVEVPAQGAAAAQPLVDTGVGPNRCVKPGTPTFVSCADPGAIAHSGASKQDGMEVRPRSYAEVPKPAGGTFARTECVKDNVTGLMWEGKEAQGVRSNRAMSNGVASDPTSETAAYVREVNSMKLCGFNDWRMPLPTELQSLLDHSKLQSGNMIDADWFPNTVTSAAGHSANGYWAGTERAGFPAYAWMVHHSVGEVGTYLRTTRWPVRLVRGNVPSAAGRYVAAGDEVTDTHTKLVWKRCLLGMTWDGSTCTGSPTEFVPDQALSTARDVAGWRLPNIIELTSLVDRDQPGVDHGAIAPGVINPIAFPNTPQVSTWSSTPGFDLRDFTRWSLMDVHFTDGYTRYFGRPSATVRLVKQMPDSALILAQMQAAPETPRVLEEIRLWVSEAFQTVRSVVWWFAEGVAEKVAEVVNGISQFVTTSFASAGSHTVVATFKDGAAGTGATLGSTTLTLQVSELQVPAAPLLTKADIGADGTAVVSGTAAPRVAVRITWPGGTTDTALAGASDGAFSFTRSAQGLSAGDVVRVVAYNTAGNSAETSLALTSSAAAGGTVVLREDFNGAVIDGALWSPVVLMEPYAPDYQVSGGTISFTSGGISSQSKRTISGARIVVKARMAAQRFGHIGLVELVDTQSGDVISFSERNIYACIGGLVFTSSGRYVLGYRSYGCPDPTTARAAGQPSSDWFDYEMVVHGNQVSVRRVSVDGAVTDVIAAETMAGSIEGRSFYLRMGAPAASYALPVVDWVEVQVDGEPSATTLPVTEDGTLYTPGGWNRADQLAVCGAYFPATSKSVLRFDVSAIPMSGARVYLNLFAVDGDNQYDALVEVFRLTAAQTAGAMAVGYRPPVASGAYASFASNANDYQRWFRVDITSLVASWRAGEPNHGLLLDSVTVDVSGCRGFASSRAAGNRPFISWE